MSGMTVWANGQLTEGELSFAGQVWRPSQSLAYLMLDLIESLPSIADKDLVYFPGTLWNSVPSCMGQILDIEHRNHKDTGGTKEDEIVGSIVAWEYPDKDKAIEMSAAGTPAVVRVLAALQRKREGGEELINSIRDILAKGGKIGASAEVCFRNSTSAFYDPETKEVIPWAEAPEDLRQLAAAFTQAPGHDVSGNYVRNTWRGRRMCIAPGGVDSYIEISGGGLVRNPSMADMHVLALAASSKNVLKIDNWNQWQALVASKKGDTVEPKVDAAAVVQASAWCGSEAPDHLFAYVPQDARGPKGQKSLRQFPLASEGKKGLDPAVLQASLAACAQAAVPEADKPVAKAKIVAAMHTWNAANPGHKIEIAHQDARCVASGFTQPHPEDGHVHPVVVHVHALATEHVNHEHTFAAHHGAYQEQSLHCGLSCSGALQGQTTPNDPQTGQEHLHNYVLGPLGMPVPEQVEASGRPAAIVQEGKRMPKNAQELATDLDALAKKYSGDADTVKLLTETRAQMLAYGEKDIAAIVQSTVQKQVDERIKAGELVLKDQLLAAVASAKEEGRKEVRDQVALEAAKAKVIGARTEAVKAAGFTLDPAKEDGDVLAALQSSINDTPTDAAGEEKFTKTLKVLAKVRATAPSATAFAAPVGVKASGGGDEKAFAL